LPLADSNGNSFTGANEGPPTDPKVFEEQQKWRQWWRWKCDSLDPKVCFNSYRRRAQQRPERKLDRE
jgi:hypothetical protein